MKILDKKETKKIKGGCPPDPRCPDIWDYCECIKSYSVVAPQCDNNF